MILFYIVFGLDMFHFWLFWNTLKKTTFEHLKKIKTSLYFLSYLVYIWHDL
jgi:hypothetical protein